MVSQQAKENAKHLRTCRQLLCNNIHPLWDDVRKAACKNKIETMDVDTAFAMVRLMSATPTPELYDVLGIAS